jgi:hypothetical protein
VRLLSLLAHVLQVFLDSEGAVVVSFQRAAAACEGDVGAYMNHQAEQGGLLQEFRCAAAVLLVQPAPSSCVVCAGCGLQ